MKVIRLFAMLFAGLVLCGCKSQPPPALGDALAGLTRQQLAQFRAGKKVFQREFAPTNGLGPLFNSTSCAECHETPKVGGSGDEVEVHATRFGGPKMCDELFAEGGPVIQQHATPLLQALGIEKEAIPPDATAQGRRSTPPLFGLGLVDAIPEATILSHAAAQCASGGPIHGHANRTIDGRVGRFGRKAATATLFDFNAGAFPQEMGITTPLSPVEETINGRPVPPETDAAPDPEITLEGIEQVTAFVQFLAPPPALTFTNAADRRLARRGQQLFVRLQCAVCHVPQMSTGPSSIGALARKPVRLYSDLLVHDMGAELADICFEQAAPSEFRTEMLMGLRFREHFLHDGSAQTIQEAIERHGGEAKPSRDRFKALSQR